MGVRHREPKLRIVRWPTPDWDYTPVGYRFIKATFHRPVWWASRLQVQGADRVPARGPLLLAVNHQTWADPVVLGAVLERPAFYLAKEGLFRNPFTRWFFESMGQIKVERDAKGNEDAVTTAVRLLDQGLVVGVFPEGTRAREGEMKRGKTGIARIAARAHVPVVPVGVATAEFWPRSSALPKIGKPVYVNVGEPVRYDLKPEEEHDRAKMREVTDDVMERIGRLFEEAKDAQRERRRWSG